MVNITTALRASRVRVLSIGVLCFISLGLSSCAKIKYIWGQGKGQVSLLHNARENSEVLKDPRVTSSQKDKIRLIKKYKEYFYQYYERAPSALYDKTSFLKDKAVTYLVIASPFREIKAKKECFYFVGCFPYLGFFAKQDAWDHAQRLGESGYATYIRPVYAYSTLGKFDDPILSSFFYYDDFDLGELIFHELFHTIFFIKDEVDLNENLANYFSEMMAAEYFKHDDQWKAEKAEKERKTRILRKELVSWVKKINEGYKENNFTEDRQYRDYLQSILSGPFSKHFHKLCSQLGLVDCFPLKRKWNNASLAAYMTYEKAGNKIEQLHHLVGGDLPGFLAYIEQQWMDYKKAGIDREFSDFLFEKVK